jgi:hypothetical protein
MYVVLVVRRTCFERDVAQHNECVGRFEPHFIVPVHLLLVYRAREIEHLPRSIKVGFRLRLVRAYPFFALTLALRIQLGRLGKQVNSGIIVTTISFTFIFSVARKRQDLVPIQRWFS